MQHVMQQTNVAVQPQVNPQVVVGCSFRDLFWMKPLEFQGILDKLKAHEVLSNMERVF